MTAALKEHWGQLRGEAIEEAYSDEVLESMAVFQMRALLTQVQLKLQHYLTHRADKSSPFIKASSSFDVQVFVKIFGPKFGFACVESFIEPGCSARCTQKQEEKFHVYEGTNIHTCF